MNVDRNGTKQSAETNKMNLVELIYRPSGCNIMPALCHELGKGLGGPCNFEIHVLDDGTATVDTPDGLELAFMRITEHGCLIVCSAAIKWEFKVCLFTEDPRPVLAIAASSRCVASTLHVM